MDYFGQKRLLRIKFLVEQDRSSKLWIKYECHGRDGLYCIRYLWEAGNDVSAIPNTFTDMPPLFIFNLKWIKTKVYQNTSKLKLIKSISACGYCFVYKNNEFAKFAANFCRVSSRTNLGKEGCEWNYLSEKKNEKRLRHLAFYFSNKIIDFGFYIYIREPIFVREWTQNRAFL